MLPEGWRLTNTGQECFSVVPGRNKPKEFSGSIPWITTPEIFGRYLPSYLQKNYVSKHVIKEAGAKIVPEGSVVISAVGELGLVAIATQEVTLNQQLHAFICKEGIYNEFLAYSIETQKPFMERVASKTTILYLNKANCESIPILLPPLPEQKKIAAILSTWDRAIEVTEKLLANSQQQKKALMQQLLAGKKRLPGFTGEWKVARLSDLGEISSAGVDKKSFESEAPVRLLNFKDVFSRTFIRSNDLNHWVTAPASKVIKCNVIAGDVFFTPSSETRGEIALSAVASEDIPNCCYSYHVVRFRMREVWDLAYKAFAFSTASFRKAACELSDGSGQRYVLSQDNFRSIEVSYPPYEEQKEIGAILVNSEREIALLKSDLSRLRQEKKALMQQLLTGKRRVKIEADAG